MNLDLQNNLLFFVFISQISSKLFFRKNNIDNDLDLYENSVRKILFIMCKLLKNKKINIFYNLFYFYIYIFVL